MPGSWSINAEKSAKLKELFESINIGGQSDLIQGTGAG